MKRVDDLALVKTEGGPLPVPPATLYTSRPPVVAPPTSVAASALQAVRAGSPHSAPLAPATSAAALGSFPRVLQPLATPTAPALNLSTVPNAGSRPEATTLRPKSPDTAIGMQSSVQTAYPGPTYVGTLPGATAAAAASPAASNNSSALHTNAANALLLQQAGGSPPATANASLQTLAHQQHLFHQAVAHQQVRHKVHTTSTAPPAAASPNTTSGQQQQPAAQPFPRLKVEDALSYLDQVKYKFGNQPQVYNDFLDIMKEFKSQSIDTPGVIARVSSLFRGHPELIVGFNTFLPLGYKIEVQSNEQDGIVSCQVSVSVPGGMSSHTTTVVHAPTGVHHISQSGVISAPLPGTAPPTIPPPNAHVTSGSVPPAAVAMPVLTIKQAVSSPGAQYAPVAPPTPAPAAPRDTSSPALHSPSPSLQTTPSTGPVTTIALPVHSPASLTPSPALSNSAGSQPVEFNHAINYVNKIKNRFQGQPEIYKQFLEILHTYQKEQRSLKEGLLPPGRHLTEAEVYDQVARLFQNQGDLLQEFGQFLPDATSSTSSLNISSISASGGNHRSAMADLTASLPKKPTHLKVTPPVSTGSSPVTALAPALNSNHAQNNSHHNLSRFGLKRPLAASPVPSSTVPMPKKPRLGVFPSATSTLRDVSLAEAAKYGTLNEYAFFDKVRKALRSQEVYDNFLRCLVLFNQDIVSRTELLQLVTPFLGKFPELLRWFKEFLGCKENGGGFGGIGSSERGGSNHRGSGMGANTPGGHIEPIPHTLSKQERVTGDLAMEIDYTTCKRLGASYCALPKSYVQPKCTGRTPLCKEVLNDTWVSFPSWSEDSTFVSSRKTQYEEYIYRCEDERYELDVVLETNLATIRVLEGLGKKMARMSPDELNRFRLDDCLGGTSPTIHLRAIRRIYGDRANDIIEGLKKNPSVAVPVVLKRLKTKEEEWREAQKGFNKIWREQNEKYYLKSLDHQGINFKQNDAKALRSKSLLNEIETLFDERQEQTDDSQVSNTGGAHLILSYKDRGILDDAAELLIHHAKRQAGIHKEDKRRIKTLLRHSLPDMFRHPRQELSEDERDDDDENHDDEEEEETTKGKRSHGPSKRNSPTNAHATPTATQTPTSENLVNGDSKEKAEEKSNSSSQSGEEKSNKERWKEEDHPPDRKTYDDSCSDEYYTLFYGNNHWYVFLRLHQILCERLAKMYDRAVILAAEERKVPNPPSSSFRSRPSPPGSASSSSGTTPAAPTSSSQGKSAAEALRLKQSHDIDVEDYYPAFLDMVKNVLDGHMESSAFEDTLRELFGTHAYLAFTLDKVVINAVRQLQHLVSEEVSLACSELWLAESKKGGGGGYLTGAGQCQAAEIAYQKKAEQVIADENMFKIMVFKEDCRITIQLLDTENGDAENPNEIQKWTNYVEDYADGGDNSNGGTSRVGASKTRGLSGEDPEDPEDCEKAVSRAADLVRMGRKPLMLRRSLRSWRKRGREEINDGSEEEGRGEDKKDPNSELVGFDGSQCRFNLQSYKMVFVVNSESVLYRRHALSRARTSRQVVSQRNHARFAKWHTNWASQHVSAEAQAQCMEWLLGRGEHVVPNRTEAVPWTDMDQPPFVPYTRYKVTRLATPSQTSATVPMETS